VELDFSCMRRNHFLVVHGGWLMIAVIDYKAGNLTSVVKALQYLGANGVVVTQDPAVVRAASKVVLPGVGHFQATQLLGELGLTNAVRESVAMGTKGLGHFAGVCERFPALYEGSELKSPHVGWNSLEGVRADSRLLRGVKDGGFVYYTHSWRAPVVEATAAVTEYGGPFTAVVERENVMGVQFHPEKSSAVGLQVLRNFVEL
jgi:imidazole glycerol-phosphate synthase subunit HisH